MQQQQQRQSSRPSSDSNGSNSQSHRGNSRSNSSSSASGEIEAPIGLGQRISQNIEMAKKGYESLVHAIIRPPRAQYQMEQLGPSDFTFLGRRYHRDDIELLSSNTMTHNTGADGGDPTKRNNVNGGDTPTCSFLRMQVSVWTRQCNNKEGDNKDADNNTDDDNDDAAFVAHREEDELRDTKEKTQPARRRRRRTKNTKTMLVYLHGNASARLEVVPSLSFLLGQVGVDGVVGVDFTGSGKSDGEYVSLGHYEQVDLDCLIQHLERVYGGSGGLGSGGIESDLEIILWGRSMGASTALMYAGSKSQEKRELEKRKQAAAVEAQQNQTSVALMNEKIKDMVEDIGDVIDHNSVIHNNQKTDQVDEKSSTPVNSNIIKGMICDSPFASLTILCEELVERARQQGVVVPGVVVSAAIAMIARSVRQLADFNIRDITPITSVQEIDSIPALFVVGADDDFISPHHSEQLIEAYTQGITTNLFMVPGGHNDARPRIVFDGIEEFCKQRLSIDDDDTTLVQVPEAMQKTIHQNPPWAYHRTIHFQEHTADKGVTSPPSSSHRRRGFFATQQKKTTTNASRTSSIPQTTAAATMSAADEAADNLGMTKDRQDDIQDKIGMMMLGKQ